MKKSESVNPNLLLKEYRSKIDSKVILRDVELENLKKQAVWIQDKIKNSDFSAQIVQLAKFKEVKYNEGDAIVDWELIKFFSLQMKNASRNVLVINFEAIFFCEWEFGRFRDKNMLGLKLKYVNDEISEDRLDIYFDFALKRNIIPLS